MKPPAAVAIYQADLAGCGLLGFGAPKLARALGYGVCSWLAKATVSTVDAGAAGVGSGVPMPLVIVPQVFAGALTTQMVAQNIFGLFAPLFISGVTLGTVHVFAGTFTSTTHAAVGVGSGVGRVTAPPAYADIQAGFKQAGIDGQASGKAIKAISAALDQTLASVVVLQPIVGGAGPSPATGVGTGSLV